MSAQDVAVGRNAAVTRCRFRARPRNVRPPVFVAVHFDGSHGRFRRDGGLFGDERLALPADRVVVLKLFDVAQHRPLVRDLVAMQRRLVLEAPVGAAEPVVLPHGLKVVPAPAR